MVRSFLSGCIPLFCLFHMLAISWWALPDSVVVMVAELSGKNSFSTKLFKELALENSTLKPILENYVDLTGSQQYWDFFAPHSPRAHQYLSVCQRLENDSAQGSISCLDKPMFTNFGSDFANFKHFGSYRSRYYRLAENLINRADDNLLKAFADYYRQTGTDSAEKKPTYLIAHEFELHPELSDLPKSGYRIDKILLMIP